MKLGAATIVSKHGIWFVQDHGRTAYNIYGIPPSGSMDQAMVSSINHLLGNASHDAVIEVFQTELVLEFNAPTTICLGGLDAVASINNVEKEFFTLLHIEKGDVLKLSYTKNAPWRYVAIKGGWQTEMVFASSSTYTPLGMNPLKKNTILPFLEKSIEAEKEIDQKAEEIIFPSLEKIKVVRGFDAHLLPSEFVASVFNKGFAISHQSNRQAYINVESIQFNTVLPDITSNAVYPGTVQLTPSGKLYILMRDCQTTGGYLRIGLITNSELNKIVRLPFGSNFDFELKD